MIKRVSDANILTIAIYMALASSPPALAQDQCQSGVVVRYGVVDEVTGADLTISTRNGEVVNFDIGPAQSSGQFRPVYHGMAVEVIARRDPDETLHALSVARAKPMPAAWGNDCD
jgi:hypothetical protein